VKRGSATKRRESKRRRFDGPIHGRIAKLRDELGLNQTDVAERLEVTSTLVSHWETGLARPEITLLPNLAKVLGTTVDHLIRGETYYTAIRAALGAS
jgi:transcriptional regulator with XRE-family HTH domain